ncbi:MAG: PIN domain nuclease [Actinomycetes bacterium]
MAAVAHFLADTSVLSRSARLSVGQVFTPLLERGLLATCPVIDFEVLWTCRGAAELKHVRASRLASYEQLPVHPVDWDMALNVQQHLWDSGVVRCVGMPDLLIAAVAARERVTVLHYDADFDRIAAVTGQPTQWVVPRGTADD